jgi:hypothetical protein
MGTVTGGCLCKAIRYEFYGIPRASLTCYCRTCQFIAGGGPIHAIILRVSDVMIIKGSAKEHWTLSEKGNRIARLFCEHCGTPLFSRNEKWPEWLSIKVGSLDDPSTFNAEANIWVGSAQPWHCHNKDLPEFKQELEGSA